MNDRSDWAFAISLSVLVLVVLSEAGLISVLLDLLVLVARGLGKVFGGLKKVFGALEAFFSGGGDNPLPDERVMDAERRASTARRTALEYERLLYAATEYRSRLEKQMDAVATVNRNLVAENQKLRAVIAQAHKPAATPPSKLTVVKLAPKE